MSNINSFIAKQVIEFRESMEWSQRELAEKMGVPHTSIARLESGEGGINSNTIEKFCNVSGKRIEFVASARRKVDDIADYIIHTMNKKYGEYYDLTKLKLQKLLYYCQVKYLAENYKPLFEHNIVHWDHGPVQKDIYYRFKPLPTNLIPSDTVLVPPKLAEEEQACVDYILNKLDGYSAWELRNMTHDENNDKNNNPWAKTNDGEVISEKLIIEYYLAGNFRFQIKR
jgi:uncharacterized phage-associated protein/DNA-binding XRE family transcriptional regulator